MKPSSPDPRRPRRAAAPAAGALAPALTPALALALAFAATLAAAAPRAVEPFDAAAWQSLGARGAAPAIVVFSTTDCSHCPAVLDRMAAHPARQRSGAALVAVVMDVAPGEANAALLDDPHYRRAQRLMAFADAPQRLRHAVNPQWRGMTPYVALLRPGQPPRFVLGTPDDAALRAWADGTLTRR